MDRLEETRLAWQRAQAGLQAALAEMERAVASDATAEQIKKLRDTVSQRQGAADDALQRHITQLGKS